MAFLLCLLVPAAFAVGQTPAAPTESKPTPTPVKGTPKVVTAEQVAETVIFWYGAGGGRTTLDQRRKTTYERGTSRLMGADNRFNQVNYQRYVIRGENLGKEKIRVDQEHPTARFSYVFEDGRSYGIFNNTVFDLREDARASFENEIHHGLEALLRYKENESQLDLAGREKVMGVDYHLLDVTDKAGRKTRFYISAKTFRVMMLTFQNGGVEYRRRFYNYNYAQGTLVPYRTVLWANDRIVEETDISTITFGQRVDETLFSRG